MKNRRLKAIVVSEEDILDLFHKEDSVLHKVWFKDLPHDAEVKGVWDYKEWGGFFIIVSHESFEEIPFGEEIPLLNKFGSRLIKKDFNEFLNRKLRINVDLNEMMEEFYNCDPEPQIEKEYCPRCEAEMVDQWNGIKCSKCDYWVCL